MPAPYPQFVYDFTAARGIAMHLETMLAKALIEHLDGEVVGSNDLVTEIVKEIYSLHGYSLSLPGLPDAVLDTEIIKLKPNAARGLVAALSRDGAELSEKANTLLETVSKVHDVKLLNANEIAEALLVCSVVYTLPRMTGAVGTVSDHVTAKWADLSSETQQELRSLISEAIRTGRTGADFDTRGWIAVLDHADMLDTATQPKP